MGVRGLTSLIDQNPHLLSRHRLHGCKAIIDGCNLAHCLYHDSKVNFTFGGDYDKFAERAKAYFDVFRECNVQLFVIFDGGYDPSNRKLRTTLDRAKNRLQVALHISKGASVRSSFLPILALETLRDVLIELKIPHAQCDYEADDQIAALANYLECPVLSLDSDFYIFDISGGFIPLDSIDTAVKTEQNDESLGSYKYLDCQIYYVSTFLSHFRNLDRSVLPLFGTLVGNDFVNIHSFDNFFANIKLPKIKSKRLKVAQRHVKMIGLLSWLESKTLEEAIEQVVLFVKKETRESLRALIYKTVESYKICCSPLIRVLELGNDTSNSEVLLKTFYQNDLCLWFSKAFFHYRLPSFLLNAVGLHRVFLPTQTDHWESLSSHVVSKPIRAVVYRLLLTADGSNGDSASIYEYDRVKEQLKKIEFKPTVSLSRWNPLPKLSELEFLNKNQTFDLLCDVWGIDPLQLSVLPRNLQFPVAVIVYWVKNADPSVTMNHLNSILLCLLLLEIHGIKTSNFKPIPSENNNMEKVQPSTPDVPNSTIPQLIELISEDEKSSVPNKFCKFFQMPVINNNHRYNSIVVHGFCQLQSCLLFSSYLNQLLLFPLPHLKTHTTFSGTFLYNLCLFLNGNSEPDLLIQKLFNKLPVSFQLFQCLRKTVLDLIPKERVSEMISSLQTSARKQKKQKAKQNSKDSASTSLLQPSQELENTFESKNKFDALA